MVPRLSEALGLDFCKNMPQMINTTPQNKSCLDTYDVLRCYVACSHAAICVVVLGDRSMLSAPRTARLVLHVAYIEV